jgi:serine/threonine protein kinase
MPDLKGSNVLLTENFDAMITDFGLTLMKHHARGISQHKGEGTCNYMAPELFIVNGPLITGARQWQSILLNVSSSAHGLECCALCISWFRFYFCIRWNCYVA